MALRRAVKNAGFKERLFNDARVRAGARLEVRGFGGPHFSFLPLRPYPYFGTRGIEKEESILRLCRFCKEGITALPEQMDFPPGLIAAVKRGGVAKSTEDLLETARFRPSELTDEDRLALWHHHREVTGVAELERRYAFESRPLGQGCGD
jgi:hypothetical protein